MFLEQKPMRSGLAQGALLVWTVLLGGAAILTLNFHRRGAPQVRAAPPPRIAPVERPPALLKIRPSLVRELRHEYTAYDDGGIAVSPGGKVLAVAAPVGFS